MMKLRIIPINKTEKNIELLESFESQLIFPNEYCRVCLETAPEYLFPGIFIYNPETLEILSRYYIIQEKLEEYGNPETETILSEE